jgi:hypothetical protein
MPDIASSSSSRPAWPGIVSRAVAAVLGGYILASAVVLFGALVLPMEQSDAVMTGLLLGLLTYAGGGLWAFTTRSARRAWLGIATPAALLGGIAWLARHGGVG